MNSITRFLASALCAAALPLVVAGCGGGGGDDDVGDNDKTIVACIGDSITQGYNCVGPSYPARLAVMSGKNVKNYGVGGTTSSYGVSVIGTALGRKPGYVCILYGANDCIQDIATETTVANLRRIVQAAKKNKSKVLLATPTPMNAGHKNFNGRVTRLAAAIRTMAKEEGVACIDLNAAFGDGTGLIGSDGLHMTDAGSDLIAKKFNSKM